MSSPFDPDFSPAERRALADLLGLPERLGRTSVPAHGAVPIAEVRRILNLPEPGFQELLAPDRWLAGGAVLRWLGHGRMRSGRKGDFDFYMPSLAAVNRSARELVAAGYRYRCFRAQESLCFLCGRSTECFGYDRTLEDVLPFPRNRCPSCGEVEQDDARLADGFPLELTAEIVRDRQVAAVELLAPQGDQIHLITSTLEPSAAAVLAHFDLSVVHFGLDPENLHFGPHAWTDLLCGRFRLVDRTDPPRNNYFRLQRYKARGFRPYLGTVVFVYGRVLAKKIRNLLP